jgi:hypothetical protein
MATRDGNEAFPARVRRVESRSGPAFPLGSAHYAYMIYIGRSRNMPFNDLRDHPTDAAQKVADKAKGVVETARGAASSIADKLRLAAPCGKQRIKYGNHANDAAEQISEHGETGGPTDCAARARRTVGFRGGGADSVCGRLYFGKTLIRLGALMEGAHL